MTCWRVVLLLLICSSTAASAERTSVTVPCPPEAGKSRPPLFLPQIKANCIAPVTHRYIVVEPRPTLAPAPAVCNKPDRWVAQNVTASPYPYGWFGARGHEQASRRGSYYGDTRDYMRLRSY